LQEFKALEHENNRLVSEISAEQDINKSIELKKKLYGNKLSMLDMIKQDDKRAGVTAREYLKTFRELPHVPRYATGIKAIDFHFKGGFESGMFIQLAGESGVGKTSLFLEIMTNIAQGNKCVFFNFEMGMRLMGKKLNRLLTSDKQLDNLIIDSDTRNLDDLVMEIELYAKQGVKFFAIDSKMKIEITGTDDEYLKISKMSSALAKLSQKRDIIILLINQMNEADIKNKRLAMKGSGDQKYDSDIALFYVMDDNMNRTLMCTKNRQDEVLFDIPLALDSRGRTVGINDSSYYSNAPETTTYEYKENINNIINDAPVMDADMPDLGF